MTISHEAISKYAIDLTADLDHAMGEAREAVTPTQRELLAGRAAGIRHALICLHIFTHGEYGASAPDLPDPYQLPPLAEAAARPGQDVTP